MAVVDLPPDLAPVNSFLDLIDQSVVYTDPRTSNALRQFRAQPIWRAQLEFQELCLDKWRALSGLLAKLRGSVNSIRLHDFSDPGDDFARSAMRARVCSGVCKRGSGVDMVRPSS